MRNDNVVILQSACLVAVVRDCLLVADKSLTRPPAKPGEASSTIGLARLTALRRRIQLVDATH